MAATNDGRAGLGASEIVSTPDAGLHRCRGYVAHTCRTGTGCRRVAARTCCTAAGFRWFVARTCSTATGFAADKRERREHCDRRE